jgi:hypothetical protein
MSDDLPSPNTKRWVVRRKAAIIVAVRSASITLEEALERYQLGAEEYRSWERGFDAHGFAGLRATGRRANRDPLPALGSQTERLNIVPSEDPQ